LSASTAPGGLKTDEVGHRGSGRDPPLWPPFWSSTLPLSAALCVSATQPPHPFRDHRNLSWGRMIGFACCARRVRSEAVQLGLSRWRAARPGRPRDDRRRSAIWLGFYNQPHNVRHRADRSPPSRRSSKPGSTTFSSRSRTASREMKRFPEQHPAPFELKVEGGRASSASTNIRWCF